MITDGRADRDGDRLVGAQCGRRDGCDLAADPLGDLDRLLGAGAAEHDGELLSLTLRPNGAIVAPWTQIERSLPGAGAFL